ncbi:MAG: hypothetical protein ABIP20_00080 [Chthoniobacteraceae bacterium]
MSESETTSTPSPAPLKAGDDWGFYKLVEISPTRIFLRADYTTGLLLLVAGLLFLLLDIAIFSHADFVVRFMRGYRALYSFRDFLTGLPRGFQAAMVALPIIGISWFLFMTGRSILVDFSRKIARRVKFFVFGPTADLGSVASVQLRINSAYTPSRGDSVALHLADAQGQSLMEFADETASADEFDSTPTTDFAKLLRITAHMAEMLRIPVTVQGQPAKMSAINRKFLEATSAPA